MSRPAMTLVEMMVALAATLLLMAAIAQVFAVFGGAISGSRAVLDLDGRMRSAAWRLRTDLGGITARTVPAPGPGAAEGYLEIIWRRSPGSPGRRRAVPTPSPTRSTGGSCW